MVLKKTISRHLSEGRNAVTAVVRLAAAVSPDAKITLRGKHGSHGFPCYVNGSVPDELNALTVLTVDVS